MTFSVRKFLKIMSLGGILIGLFGMAFIIHTINRAPIKVFETTAVKHGKRHFSTKSLLLETGAGTSAELLQNYILFSEEKRSYKDWARSIRGSLIKKRHGKLIINKDINLPAPIINDCKQVYCFQKRLRFENIPSIFWKGLIGIEDERFLLHKGIDFKSLARAFIHDLFVMKLEQGGSTLTQQIVKNLFYSNEKKFSRKIKEMILAVYIESKYEKEKIIQAYFNEVIWGGKQGIKIKGLFAASLFYFSKKPDAVSPYEAAILISLLKGPNYYNPLGKINKLRPRANLVYKKLVKMNMFPPEKGEKWGDDLWEMWISKLKNKQKAKPYRNNWWLSSNISESELGIFERYVLHSRVSSFLVRVNKKLKGKDIAVKIYIGDLNKKSKNFFYYSKYERNWENAKSKEKHTLGSSIKPLIYSMLLDLGSTMSSEVETGELAVKLKSGIWKPREAHKIAEAKVTLEKALKLSYNRPIVRESMNQGLSRLEKKMIIEFPHLKVPLEEYPAQILGTVEVSLENLFEIYRKFIIKDCKREDESIVRILSNPKETTIRKIVGDNFGGLKFFGKTGTSNNGFDNWFVFYEGSRLGVIWTGLEGERSGKDLRLYGGTTSFRIFKEFYMNSGKRFGEFICEGGLLSD